MKLTASGLLLLIFSLSFGATRGYAEPPEPAQVMLFSSFHFANPGQDVVKTDQLNVMTEANQQYLMQLSKRLAGFKPTTVLLEYNPADQQKYHDQYQAYLQGNFELASNEVYQLGFRVASLAGLDTVSSFDERSIEWNAEPLFEFMALHDASAQARFDAAIARLTADSTAKHSQLTLSELLIDANDQTEEKINKALYLLTNDVGAGGNFVGADAAASWWHRNFRMYAKVQAAATPGSRVLVIGGQGHMAILKDFLELDLARVAADVRPVLAPAPDVLTAIKVPVTSDQ